MRVIQLLPTIAYGDAIGNDVMALDHTLKKAGYTTGIYAENIDSRLPSKLACRVSEMPTLQEEDIILYHFSTGTELNYQLPEYKAKKILIYHNVTPHQFFEMYSDVIQKNCFEGEKGLRYLADKVDYCIADSEYNKADLQKAGYTCRIDVLPILIPFTDYEKEADKTVIRRYGKDGYTNVLFTGRIVPNKKQEDVISAFYMYQKYYNPKSRLFLVGSNQVVERYYAKLCTYVEKLNLTNVYFSGHIKFSEILAYYQIADLFLCMSEHEGFCVPLVEAMYFDVPIIAYDSSAISDTLGGTGILLKQKNALETAGMMDHIIRNTDMKERVAQEQRRRLEDYSHNKIEKQFLNYLEEFIKKEEPKI